MCNHQLSNYLVQLSWEGELNQYANILKLATINPIHPIGRPFFQLTSQNIHMRLA